MLSWTSQSRFRSPLIKPDVRSYRIRLSDRLRTRTRSTSPNRPQGVDFQWSEDKLQRELASATRARRLVAATKKVTHPIVNVTIQTGIGPSHGPVREVILPPSQ